MSKQLKILSATHKGELYSSNRTIVGLIELAQMNNIDTGDAATKLPKLKKKIAECVTLDLEVFDVVMTNTKMLLERNRKLNYEQAYTLCKHEAFKIYGLL